MSDPVIYYLLYPQGSCGSFISLILAQMMWPKLAKVESFTDKGIADAVPGLSTYVSRLNVINHNTANPALMGLTIDIERMLFRTNPYVYENTQRPGINNEPLIERIKYLPKREKFIFSDHYFPDFNKVYSKYPNTKFLIIGYDKNTAVRLHANRYYKTIDRPHRKLNHTIHQERNRWEGDPARTGNLKDLDIYDFPEWAVKEYSENYSEFDTAHIAFSNPAPWPELENMITRINLYQIIHDHKNILDELSEWTGCSIPPETIATYENYLASQKELLPWVDDKLT